jgi:hypothetical protein
MVHNDGAVMGEGCGCFLSKRWKMKSYSIVAAAVLFAVGSAGLRVFAAQQPGTEVKPGQTGTENPNPANMGMFYVLAEFTGSLNVKKLKPGDQIKARVAQDVFSHGKVIIPAESKLLGHVTEAKERGKEDSESRLGIVFDKVLLKHHEEMDFQGVVQALAPPAPRRSRLDEPDQMLPPAIVNGQSTTSMTPLGGATSNRGSRAANARVAAASVPSFPVLNDGPASPNPTTSTPLSVGMPQGVFGLKGLSLSTGASSNTPGPVILSKVKDVKLDYDTQVLLKITGAQAPQP